VRLVNCRMILRTVCKDHVPGKLDPALLKALARGRRWFEEMASDRIRSCAEIARREGLQKGYLARLMRLTFVAPRIVDAVAAGRAPAGFTLQMVRISRSSARSR
jgi:hypothetical protein